MSYEENLRSMTYEADASIGIFTGPAGMPGSASPNHGKQYCFVKQTGKDQVGLATAAADVVAGILQNKPQGPGHAATVGYEGVSNLRVAAACAAGALLAPDAAGLGVVDAVNGKWQAMHPATAAGEVIPARRVR